MEVRSTREIAAAAAAAAHIQYLLDFFRLRMTFGRESGALVRFLDLRVGVSFSLGFTGTAVSTLSLTISGLSSSVASPSGPINSS
ncbi:hypothetical protein Ancab_025437 [Ancistrocladus abbreviatus]